MRRQKVSSRKYGRSWKRIRDRYIRNHPLCEICGAKAEEVHHLIPICEGGKHTDKNLMSLCHDCHKYQHERSKYDKS